MSKIFEFGEKVSGYDYQVINERDARVRRTLHRLLSSVSLS